MRAVRGLYGPVIGGAALRLHSLAYKLETFPRLLATTDPHPTLAMSVLATLCALAAPAPMPVQSPELFVLARQNRIMKVTGYDGPNPVTEVVTNYQGANLNLFPRGLEIDRVTGDFFVLMSALPGSGTAMSSEILRVDRSTGQTLNTLTLPFTNLDGLEQRSDGEFFAIDSGADLIRIDMQSGSTTSIPLTPPLSRSLLGLTIDEAGMILVNQFSSGIGVRYTIDPVDGTVTSLPSVGGIMGLESDGNGRLFRGGLTFGIGIVIEDLVAGTVTEIPGTAITSNVYALRFAVPVDGEGFHPICAGSVNSTGEAATLEVLGTSSITGNDLTFYSRNLPQASFGYFLTGPNLGFMPVGSGLLCIGGPQFRYSLSPLNSGTAGVVRFDIDLFNLPSGGPPIAGRTEIFQYWYRDFGSTSNLSAALAVTMR